MWNHHLISILCCALHPHPLHQHAWKQFPPVGPSEGTSLEEHIWHPASAAHSFWPLLHCDPAFLGLQSSTGLDGWVTGPVEPFTGASFLGLNSWTWSSLSWRYVAVLCAPRLSAQTTQKICVLMSSVVIWPVCVAGSIMVLVNSEAIEVYGDIMCLFAP